MKSQPMVVQTFLLLGLFFGLGLCGVKAEAINGVDWATVYKADRLPDAASPAWTLVSNGGTAEIVDNQLAIKAEPGENLAYRISSGWNGDTDMTVEVRFRLEARGGGRVASLAISNSSKYLYLNFSRNAIFYSGGTEAGTLATGLDLTADFNTLRVTMSSDLAVTVYLNGDPTPIGVLSSDNFSAGPRAPNDLLFGVAAANVGGLSHWEYVAWTPGIHPVP